MEDIVRMGLVPAIDEQLGFNATQAALHAFDMALTNAGIDASSNRMHFRDGIGSSLATVGQYAMPLASVLVPTFAAVVVAWLKGRAGRKVRFQVGDIRIEAQSAEDVALLVDKAAELYAKIPMPRKGRTKIEP